MQGILNFVSETAFAEHSAYLNNLKLRYSILEKSEAALSGLELSEIESHREIKGDIRREATSLLSEIKAHELYFSSFSERGCKCPALRGQYSSESAFVYELFKNALNYPYGFCCVSKSRGGIRFDCTEEPSQIFTKRKPLLCIDIFEHAYFRDYGFRREEYLKNALSYLNLSRLLENPVKL